ncbi:hypothetical protein, partial [Streptomyces turgidiscabies]|uniref:hypothetical protein n=2 Tax=Streptomyces TaxID=1883 RepID=UPI0038F6FF72
MHKINLLALSLTLFSLPSLADDNTDLKNIIDQHWQHAQNEKIFFRTDPDGWKPNGKLANWTEQAIQKRQTYNNQVLQKLAAIDEQSLSKTQLMNYRLFK